MINKKFIVIVLSLSLVLLITGCSGGLGGLLDDAGSGSISGDIELVDSTINPVGTEVWVIEEDPTADDLEVENITIVESTTVNDEEGIFNIEDIPVGTYY